MYRKSQTGGRFQVEGQYVFFTTALTVKLCNRDQTWVVVQQVGFITGARSRALNEVMRSTCIRTLTCGLGLFLLFKVPQTGIDTIRSKLTMNLHDEYANVLKGMYSVIFNGGASSQNTSIQV